MSRSQTAGGAELRYAVFLAPNALISVHAALGGNGTVHSLADTGQLMAELAVPRDECLVLDPALLTPSLVETVATRLAECPRDVVAFSSVTTAALESAVILAQRTAARFVFRGTPNERAALERALLLTPDVALHSALLSLIEPSLDRLPSVIRERVVSIFRGGEGPYSPDSLAVVTSLPRRSMDRYIAAAGFTSARWLIEAARVTSGYRAITVSRIPLKGIASMLGYSGQRGMDAQLKVLLGVTAPVLRAHPLPCDEAASRLAHQLITHESRLERRGSRPTPVRADANVPLRLVKDDTQTSRARRTTPEQTVINS